MNTLDRYIARQYFTNIVLLFVLLFSFVVTIDVALTLDRYLNVLKETQGAAELSTIGRFVRTCDLIADIWWPRLLQLFVFLLGMVQVGAMGFTMSQLVRNRELVAMMAGGVSLRRVARPVLIVAGFMTLLQIADQEFVIPRIAPLLTRDQGDAGKHDLKEFKVPLVEDGAGGMLCASRFEPATNTLTNPTFWTRGASGLFISSVSAPFAKWKDDAWRFENASVWRHGESPTASPSPAPDGAPVSHESVVVRTAMDPKALTLRHYSNFSHSLSWSELNEVIAGSGSDQGMRDKLIRIKYGRVSAILSNLLTLLIVLPLFLTREPRNMVLQSLKGAPVGIGSLLGGLLGASMTIPGLAPGLGVFVPVVILAPIAVANISSMRT